MNRHEKCWAIGLCIAFISASFLESESWLPFVGMIGGMAIVGLGFIGRDHGTTA